MLSNRSFVLLCLVAILFLATPAAAFGAGNIASISKIEGHNWRHGDIEDLLTTVAFIRGHKWTSMQIKRTYFGNWLRDYSQAVDVGTLKGVQAETIRVLVWVLAFMSFGYATEEFEVTSDRLGTYRPEEHIDNPKDYADNADATQFDKRLRAPVRPIELAIDPDTGMKNYIANEQGDWATSLGYVKWSFARSIHYGRLYTHGSNKGRSEDLCEALRCLGQGLHTLEDFGAHTNYTELVLRELGFMNVFPHVGAQTMINVHGKQIFPLTTGTFGGVDFLHSVLGEASDHVTQSEVDQSEVDQVNAALNNAAAANHRGGGSASEFTNLLAKVPGTDNLAREAVELEADSKRQEQANEAAAGGSSYTPYGNQYASGHKADNSSGQQFEAPPGTQGGPPGPGIPGVAENIDPVATAKKIYPILAFRDRVVRTIHGIVEKIPGLEKLIDTITEKVTVFIMGLLAPYVKPLIAAASNALKTGSGGVVAASQKQQYLVWEDPTSSDPTHSLLSKDHFSNVLNEPAGQVAGAILQYAAPRVIYGWDHPEVPEAEILADVAKVFHHPALRDEQRCEIHRTMFQVVEKWARSNPVNGQDLNVLLSSESVKAGKNHVAQNFQQSLQGLEGQLQNLGGIGGATGSGSHSATAGGPLAMFGFGGSRDLGAELGNEGQPYGGYESGGGQTYEGRHQEFGAHGGYEHASYGSHQAAEAAAGESQYGSGYQSGGYGQSGEYGQQSGYGQSGQYEQQGGGGYGQEGYGGQRYDDRRYDQGGYSGGGGYDRRY